MQDWQQEGPGETEIGKRREKEEQAEAGGSRRCRPESGDTPARGIPFQDHQAKRCAETAAPDQHSEVGKAAVCREHSSDDQKRREPASQGCERPQWPVQLDGERLSQVLAVMAELVELHRERGQAARFVKCRGDERLSAVRPIDARANFPGRHLRRRKLGGKIDPHSEGPAPGAPEGRAERAG